MLGQAISSSKNTKGLVLGTRRLYAIGDSQTFQNIAGLEQTNNSITALTNADPCVVTQSAHGYETGDEVFLFGCAGMTQVNEKVFTITVVDANSFSLNGIDSTAYGTYTGGQGRAFCIGNTAVSSDNRIGKISNSWIGHALKFMGQRFEFEARGNRGVSSEQTSSMVARLSEHLPKTAGITDVIIVGGTNDANALVALATYQANINSMMSYVHTTLKARVIIGTIPPWDGQTTAQKDLRDSYNAWIKTLGSSVKGAEIMVVDFYSVLADPATRQYNTGMTGDGIHPNGKGAMVMGQKMAQVLSPVYGVGEYREKATNLIVNPSFTGTGGTATGGSTTWTNPSQVATNWTANVNGNATSPATRVLSKDGQGRQVIDFSFPALLGGAEGGGFSQVVGAGSLVDGQWYTAEMLLLLDQYNAPDPSAYPADFSIGIFNGSTQISKDGGLLSGTSYPEQQGSILKTQSGLYGVHFKCLPVKYIAGVYTSGLKLQCDVRFKTDVATGLSAKFIPVHAQLYPVASPYV